ncbi:MAG: cytochrome P450 [Betaproteobacteria bacterium]
MIVALIAWVEFALLALAAALTVRLLAKPPLRHDARAHPAFALTLAAALAIGALVAYGAIAWPPFRHAAAAAALATMAALAWRARPGYGTARGWPRGSLGLAASLDAIGDRRYYFDQAARHGPVFKMSQFGRPVACVVGVERGQRILAEHAEALAPASLPFNRLLTKGILRYMAAADHRAEAPVFRAAFARLDLAGAEDVLRAALRHELDALAERSSDGGAYAREAFERWIVASFARLFLGLDPGDARVATLASILPKLGVDRAGGARWRRDLADGIARFAPEIRAIARDRATGAPGIAGGTPLEALASAPDGGLDRPARIENFALVFRLASKDLVGLMDWILHFAGTAPGALDDVRAHGRTAGVQRPGVPNDPATAFVMETLRLEQSEYLYRRVAHPFELDGFRIPAGWILRLCIQESHRDPTVFPDPDRFDPRRFRARAYSRAEFSPFGGHPHGCMGAHVTYFLGRLFVEELALGYRWRVVRDGPPERGSRHRDHWRPSAQRRIALRSRAADETAMPRA